MRQNARVHMLDREGQQYMVRGRGWGRMIVLLLMYRYAVPVHTQNTNCAGLVKSWSDMGGDGEGQLHYYLFLIVTHTIRDFTGKM